MDIGDTAGQAAGELPYQEITTPEYATIAAGLFTAEEAGHDVTVLRGTCPRCGAVLEVSVVSDVFQGVRSLSTLFGGRPAAPQPGGHVEPMACTCVDDHPGRPEGRVGCGAYWTLLLTSEPA
ncbi:hypothetical protein GCM10010306_103410 [Streptomyces umbrinus]|uniref:hypothetical protein n=1 Tax=Streptomyces umbrinus TaxID=67370 RepID=UPI0016761E14|nr:hypothetical protein [Streptomyces umbrinus]GHB91560.1 hypothetical protein GCM10010306_103410 [Streptomyces umbrinus]